MIDLSFPLATMYLTAAQMSNVTIVLLYAALLVVVTSLISLRTKDPDPMLAGRNMSWWLIGSSIIGTSISSIAFLAFPVQGYRLDFNFLLAHWINPIISVPIPLLFFVGFLRTVRNASIYTLLEDRFGAWASVFASLSFILYSILRMGVITCLVGQAIHVISGADVLSVILLTGSIVIFYTYMSGIEGVIWTDFFQTLILGAVGLISLYFLWVRIPHESFEMTAFFKELTPTAATPAPQWSFSGIFLGSAFLIFDSLSCKIANQGFAQRYLVARSDSHAKIGMLISGLIIPCVVLLFFLIGVFLRIYYQREGIVLEGLEVQNVFSHFITHHFPNGLKGLAIIGILAAAMSTIDTGINSSSTVLICNLYEPYTRASLLQKPLLMAQMLRASSVIFGALGIAMAYIVLLAGENILEFFWKGIALVSTGVFGLFILIRVSKVAGPVAGICGSIAGLLMTLWITLTSASDHSWSSPFHYMLAMPMGVFSVVLVGYIVTLFVKENDRIGPQLQGISESLRARLYKSKRSTKKSIFSDALRPKPFCRIYAFWGMLIDCFLYIKSESLGLAKQDCCLLLIGIIALGLVVFLPFIVQHAHNKFYSYFYLSLLAYAFPFLGAMAFFVHLESVYVGYFYLMTLIVLGNMVSWSMLGLLSMLATAAAAQLAPFIYEKAGIPDPWATVAIGALGIFTYYAMSAARDHLTKERSLGGIHAIVEKIYNKLSDSTLTVGLSKKALDEADVIHLSKAAGDVKDTLRDLIGASNLGLREPNEALSVCECIDHALKKFSRKAQASVIWDRSIDFNVLGMEDALVSAIGHLLDNAFYYVERGEASIVKILLDAEKKTLSFLNDGPVIKPEDASFIFDLGYTKGKESIGLGLAYCKKVFEGMRANIRLISRPCEFSVHFCIYFPRYLEPTIEYQKCAISSNLSTNYEQA